jgi:hypothetical protein
MSRAIHRRSHSVPSVAEALRPHPLRSPKPRVHYRRQLPHPAWKAGEAQLRRQVRKLLPLSPNAPPTVVEAQLRRPRSTPALPPRAIPAPLMTAVALPLVCYPPSGLQDRAMSPATRVAAQQRPAIPARAACGRGRDLGHRLVAPQFLIAAIPPAPWCAQLCQAEVQPPSPARSKPDSCAPSPTTEQMACSGSPPGSEHADLPPASDLAVQPASASLGSRVRLA